MTKQNKFLLAAGLIVVGVGLYMHYNTDEKKSNAAGTSTKTKKPQPYCATHKCNGVNSDGKLLGT